VYFALLLVTFISAEFMSVWSLPGGWQVANLPKDLLFERLVISHGEILNTSKSPMQQPGGSKIWKSKKE